MNTYKINISNWGRYPFKECSVTDNFFPLKSLDVFKQYSGITPRGLGRSYGDASLGRDTDLVIQTPSMNKFISFDKENGLLNAFSGVSLENILDLIIPCGWFLPVVPGTRFITLGGALASNVHGKNHHNTGAIAKFVNAFDIINEKGIFKCSENNNADLFKASLGGLGLTGLIQSAEIKLKKIETSFISARLIKANNFEEAISLSKENDSNYEYSVTWVDCLSKGKNLGRGIVMLGNHSGLKDISLKLRNNPLNNKWKTHFKIPDLFPGWVLNPLTIKSFNFGYYNKQFKKEAYVTTNFENWFFPLDLLSNWNVLYGKKGFVQYQFTIPFQKGEKGIKEILEYLSKKQIGSFLAVLKIVKNDDVLLPFAVKGFTLALDIPLRHKKIFEYLNELDHIVIKYGGRLYLTKDARLSSENFRIMYPEYNNWINIVREYNPNKKFYSLLAERLKL